MSRLLLNVTVAQDKIFGKREELSESERHGQNDQIQCPQVLRIERPAVVREQGAQT
jgi:hypothetical protein